MSFVGWYLVGMLSVKLPYDLEAPAFPPLSGLLGYLGQNLEVTHAFYRHLGSPRRLDKLMYGNDLDGEASQTESCGGTTTLWSYAGR